jgi:hypothetical protein
MGTAQLERDNGRYYDVAIRNLNPVDCVRVALLTLFWKGLISASRSL